MINALCDLYHPCQALADFLTLKEQFGDVREVTLAYVGDGNNVTHSLLLMGAILGSKVIVVTPQGHQADAAMVAKAQALAEQSGGSVVTSTSIADAQGADVIYADTWVSMGDTTPMEQIKATFAPYQVNEALMQASGAQFVMHCQPAHRDVEISGTLIDSEQSLLMQQAENRMHAQNAILIHLLGND